MLKTVLMCRPNYFQVKYQINPWMKPGSVDLKKAIDQWEDLVQRYNQNGIKVKIIDQVESEPDMPFAADQGLVISPELSKNNQKTIVLSNFRYPERQGETKYYKKWFEDNGYQVEHLPSDINFEGGGEMLPWKGKYLIGQGFRNSTEANKYLKQKYGIDFIAFELVNEKFYHLDTCMFLLNDDTVFYYPPAFSSKSIAKIKELFKNSIEFTTQEVEGFAANSVITKNLVFMQSNNTTFRKKVEILGYKAIEVDVSEFIKSGGGIHCLTFELERVPHLEFRTLLNIKNKINNN